MALDIDELKRIVPELVRDELRRDGLGLQEAKEAIKGATLEDIRAFEAEYGVSLSQDVVEWLLMANGINCGPNGLYGISGPMALGTFGAFQDYPDWRARNWFPVAGDGCGNHYISYSIKGHDKRRPVCFIDVIKNASQPYYIVASSIWHFIYFLLRKEYALFNEEAVDEDWPLDREYVLGQDPEIEFFSKSSKIPMPWDLD